MKKALIVFFAVVIACGGLFAGGGGQQGGQAGGSKIVLRAIQQIDTSTPYYTEDFRQIWDPFLKANPDIGIELEEGQDAGYHGKIEAYAAADQLPELLCVFPAGRSSTLHSRKMLKDLTPLIERDGLRSQFIPWAMDPSEQLSGYVAMIPRGLLVTHVFFVNKTVLADCGLQPARTYAEMKAQVPVLRAKGYDCLVMGNQDTWVCQSCLFSMVAGRFCGEGWEKKIHSGAAKFTDPDFVGALNFLKQMYDDGVLNRNVLATEYGSVPGLFANNRAAYFIDGDWRANAFATDPTTGVALLSPQRQSNDIIVQVFPDIEGAKINKSTSGQLSMGWSMSAKIPAGSAVEEAAWRAIKWLASKEVQTVELNLGRISAPTRNDIDFSSIKVEPIIRDIFSLASKYDTLTGVIDNVFHADVWTPINDGLAEIGMGSSTPQQVAQRVQQAFDRWRAAQ